MARNLLEDRADIADLLCRYAFNIRHGRPEACGALFTEDVTFDVRERDPDSSLPAKVRTSLAGKDAVLRYIARAKAGGTVVPILHNLLVQVSGDAAAGNCLMTSRTFPPGQEVVGEYDDGFRFEGRWLFSSRIFTILRSVTTQ